MSTDNAPLEDLLPEEPPSQLVVTAGADAAVAGQWRLMAWRFGRHKLAVVSLVIIALLYLIGIFAEFLAPYGTDTTRPQYTYAPP
ncbi:MAG: ABC transporter permease, partial [Devosia sp.]